MTYSEDFDLRRRFLRTAEIAGSMFTFNEERYCLLADVALVGEAKTLEMRTPVPWIGCETENRIK